MKVIQGAGMPTYKNPFSKGDMIIKFSVHFPSDGFASENQMRVSTDGLWGQRTLLHL